MGESATRDIGVDLPAIARAIRPASLHGLTMQGRARALWKTKQFDTVDIAERLGMTEDEVCAAIWSARP